MGFESVPKVGPKARPKGPDTIVDSDALYLFIILNLAKAVRYSRPGPL